jgi:hypothetical protein
VGEIKVTDRRMFTPDGRLRDDVARELETPSPDPEPEPEPAPAAPPSPAPPPAPPLADLVAGGGAPGAAAGSTVELPENPPLGLLEHVEFLATLALMCMGEVPQPDGRLARDLDAARFYIDLIGSFHARWSKRLGPQELRFLESYLDQLRLRFVAHRR